MAYNYNPYNNYYSQNYNNNMSYNPMPQTQMQRPQIDTPIQDLRFVTSEEAKAYIVYPNTTALLIDKASKIAYLKSTDNLGQSSMKMFKYGELNTNDDTKNEEYLMKNFVHKDTLDTIVNDINAQLNELKNSINKQIEE